ncbi:hypothetical protein GCM10008941_09100 [Rhizomicrobium palustre]
MFVAQKPMEVEFADTNKFARLAELLCDVPSQTLTSKGFAINVELRFGVAKISNASVSFEIRLSQAYLKLDLRNCTIVRGSRYADADKGKRRTAKQTYISSSQKSAGAKIEISSEPTATAGASINGKTSEEITATEVLDPVIALPDTIWNVSEQSEQKALSGKYLGDENLCTVMVDEDNFSIDVSLFCYAADVKISKVYDSSKGVFARLSPLKQRCIEIFVAKSIKQTKDEIHISESRLKGQRNHGSDPN